MKLLQSAVDTPRLFCLRKNSAFVGFLLSFFWGSRPKLVTRGKQVDVLIGHRDITISHGWKSHHRLSCSNDRETYELIWCMLFSFSFCKAGLLCVRCQARVPGPVGECKSCSRRTEDSSDRSACLAQCFTCFPSKHCCMAWWRGTYKECRWPAFVLRPQLKSRFAKVWLRQWLHRPFLCSSWRWDEASATYSSRAARSSS